MKAWKIIFLNCFWLVSGEEVISVKDVESLVKTELALLEVLERYIHSRENEINQLKRMADGLGRKEAINVSDASQFVSNPVSIFKMVRKLARDWEVTRSLIFGTGIQDEARRKWRDIERTMAYPNEKDLEEAAFSLIRSQDVKYDMERKCNMLNTTSLAEGKLSEANNRSDLTADEYFELGVYAFNQLKYRLSGQLMYEALARCKTENEGKQIDKTDLSYVSNTIERKIYDYLPYSIFIEGNTESAFNLKKEIIENFSPDHEGAWECQELIINAVKIINFEEKNLAGSSLYSSKETQGSDVKAFTPELKETFELLCKGAVSTPASVLSKLSCRYVSTSPFTKLARLKEEEAFLKPRIVLFRDVMYDSEIEIIKRLATLWLERATVQNYETGQLETANYRISKSAWLTEMDDEVVRRVSRRVEDMTGLTTKTAEALQVVNYGIGGHYVPHFDFATKEEINAFEFLGTGNRISTVLFYMSDVAQGGATVFPELKLSLWPEKGTAAVWMNLLANGEGDYSTRHAACPVLAGSKWVSNKWLHEIGQERLRPCSLNPSE